MATDKRLEEEYQQLSSFLGQSRELEKSFFENVPNGTVIYSVYDDEEDDIDEDGNLRAYPITHISC